MIEEPGGDRYVTSRWAGRVDARLEHLDEKATTAIGQLEAQGRLVAELLGKLSAHDGSSAAFRASTERRLGDHEEAILELRKLVYKGVAVGTILGTVSGTLIAWVVQHAVSAATGG